MMRYKSLVGLCVLAGCFQMSSLQAQNGVVISEDANATLDASALLDVQSTTKGVLVPRMTTAQRDAIVSPANGLMIYNQDAGVMKFQYFDGTVWQDLGGASGGASVWAQNGADINFVGGKVGVGTNDPKYDLSVQGMFNAELNGDFYGAWLGGEARTDKPSMNVGAWYNNKGTMLWDAASKLFVFETASDGSTYPNTMVLKQGNVGIGTTAPAHKLDVAGTINATSVLENGLPVSPWTRNGGNVEYTSGDVNVLNGNITLAKGSGAVQPTLRFIKNGNDAPQIKTNSGNQLGFYDSYDNEYIMVIDQGQNRVGIGTTTPGAQLEIKNSSGYTKFSGTMYSMNASGQKQISFNDASGLTSHGAIKVDQDNIEMVTVQNGSYLFKPAVGNPYMSVDFDGTATGLTFAGNNGGMIKIREGDKGHITTGHNFGINTGTTLALAALHVKGRGTSATNAFMVENNSGDDLVVVRDDGKVGFGVTVPARKIHVNDAIRLEPLSSAPSSPVEGDMYMDATDHKLKVYDGTTWQSCW